MKLNVGCGEDIREGWINLDNHSSLGSDYVWDLNNLPLPFKDGEFDYVYCSHVIEDWTHPRPIIDELVRITKVNGLIEIRTPFETNAWDSIDHARAFNKRSFITYAEQHQYGIDNKVIIKKLEYYASRHSWRVIYPAFFAWIFNKLPFMVVERTLLKYLCPALSVKVIYQKIEELDNQHT